MLVFVLADNNIRDIRPLADLTRLKELDLAGNPILGISPVAGLTNLKYLCFGEHQRGDKVTATIPDLDPVAGLIRLEALELGKRNLEGVDLTPLSKLTSLKELSLQGSGIGDVSALATLTNLEVLWLHWGTYPNRIRDISPLRNLAKLRKLEIGGSEITDISAIAGLAGLCRLNIALDPIRDIAVVSHLLRSGAFKNCEGPGQRYLTLSTATPDLSPGSANRRALDELEGSGVTINSTNP